MTFELSLKTLKDYLFTKDIDAKFPRDVIKEAFKYEIIKDGDIWMDMLDKRNLLAYTYDEITSNLAVQLIKEKYFGAIENLHQFFKSIEK